MSLLSIGYDRRPTAHGTLWGAALSSLSTPRCPVDCETLPHDRALGETYLQYDRDTQLCGWSNAFGLNDAQNQALADWYDIVMEISHEEPMMRSRPVEWGLFGSGVWDYGTNVKNIRGPWAQGTERSETNGDISMIGMRGAGVY